MSHGCFDIYTVSAVSTISTISLPQHLVHCNGNVVGMCIHRVDNYNFLCALMTSLCSPLCVVSIDQDLQSGSEYI